MESNNKRVAAPVVESNVDPNVGPNIQPTAKPTDGASVEGAIKEASGTDIGRSTDLLFPVLNPDGSSQQFTRPDHHEVVDVTKPTSSTPDFEESQDPTAFGSTRLLQASNFEEFGKTLSQRQKSTPPQSPNPTIHAAGGSRVRSTSLTQQGGTSRAPKTPPRSPSLRRATSSADPKGKGKAKVEENIRSDHQDYEEDLANTMYWEAGNQEFNYKENYEDLGENRCGGHQSPDISTLILHSECSSANRLNNSDDVPELGEVPHLPPRSSLRNLEKKEESLGSPPIKSILEGRNVLQDYSPVSSSFADESVGSSSRRWNYEDGEVPPDSSPVRSIGEQSNREEDSNSGLGKAPAKANPSDDMASSHKSLASDADASTNEEPTRSIKTWSPPPELKKPFSDPSSKKKTETEEWSPVAEFESLVGDPGF
ncbi:hypothetical protein B0T14DRAFT_499439 [Immersiella caudata]|uniref:Uncharacterized protein n=1 Tax=Immersiella caudata TaxID=314043 RepID=A0AA40BUG6_9PEZI|nr:hypothetical protein B0T14DRAFT_499439 [Immersiella caudata]